ncbi:J domain-containing protein [Rhabdothermincola salaria]|uniref:J domain-containing protein n=1 Tax=Rhabdothermincola salaria TaxID=2903142 RepID=UPI001E578A63|nr:J domain-containing protein [Rhabdothermincola salaria]
MSTHYEVLGVAATASPEAIRGAYVAIAKANHPDRRASDDPARRAAADATMKRANQAWFVLRDPGRRSEYDRTLSRPATAPSSSTASARPSGGVGGERIASGVVVPAAHAGFFRWVPVVVAVVVLGGILVFSAYATSQDTTTPTGPTTTAPTFPVGSCVLVAALDTGPQPVKVACGTGNSARVDSIVATPRPCPPDSVGLPLDDNRTTLCLKSTR